MLKNTMFVIPTEPGDPVSSVFVDGNSIVVGTLLGKVQVYDINRNSRKVVAGFSDEGVRGIYLQDGTIYATVGDLHCRQIRIMDPYDQLETKFNRRSTSSGFKYVIQKFNQVTIFYPGMTIFIDVCTNVQSMCPFKLQHPMALNVCPIDCYHYQVILSEFPVSDLSPPPPRKFKVMDVSTGDLKCELFDPRISQVRFINEHLLVLFAANKWFIIYDILLKKEISKYSNFHKSDVVAIDCSLCIGDAGRPWISSVGSNGSVVVWNYETGKVEGESGQLRSPCFSLGFPYCIQAYYSSEKNIFQIALSDDYGVHYLELARPQTQV